MGDIDWKLLLFLLLFVDVKLIIKVIAIVLIYALRFNFRFGFKLRSSRLPLFYIAVIAMALLNWLLYGLYSNPNYNIALITGMSFWVLCILAVHQLKLAVDGTNPV